MRKLKLLTLLSGLAIGERYGGAERLAVEVTCRLDRRRFDPFVCALWRYDTPAEERWVSRLAEAGVPVFLAGDGGANTNPLALYGAVARLRAHFKGVGIDVVQCHSPLAAVAALSSRRAIGSRILVRTSQTYLEWGFGPAAFLCRQLFTNWLFPAMFDIELGVSHSIVTGLDSRPGARILNRKASVMYNAVDLAKFKQQSPDPRKRLELGLGPSDLVVGSVGRLSKEKNFSMLLNAIPRVIAQKPEARFLIIGEGPLRDDLRSQAERLGLTPAVIFAGARSDVDALYPLMDLFVLPSLGEGLPLVILEAMASGVPVLATDVGGSRELVLPGRTGWLTPSEDPIALAESILAALADPQERINLARAANEDVTARFSVDRIAAEYAALYLRAAGEAPAPPAALSPDPPEPSA
jgi:glycosyltransferase involved in cell wall biosynthesis